jgi:hypothetical protein
MLLIAANGSGAGKTTLACKVLEQLKGPYEPIAVKISPHSHPIDGRRLILEKTEHFMIVEELDRNSNKDTSKLLRAGASVAYLIHGNEDKVVPTFLHFVNKLASRQPLICESAGIAFHLQSGLLIALEGKGIASKPSFQEIKELADITIHSDGKHFDFDPANIWFDGSKWNLNR